ncbi:MAG: sigma-70 family RNA polymerase sigma factor [Candidatus Nealsonbacteria bacterium]|nr:sigma-70 family RNA polymerase sigma factor [Candidatus Nealsonbacteria bacterium]
MQAENQDAREQAEESAAREAVALEDLVAEHQQRIAGLAYRLLDRPDDVADVVQEVFLAAFRNLRRFRGESSLATWLTTITVNKCRSHVRRRRLGLRAWLEIAARAVASGGGPGPGEAAEVHEEVRRAVGRLPRRFREPIVLRYFQKMPIAEIAEVLRISPCNVEVRLSRARARLRETLSVRLNEP